MDGWKDEWMDEYRYRFRYRYIYRYRYRSDIDRYRYRYGHRCRYRYWSIIAYYLIWLVIQLIICVLYQACLALLTIWSLHSKCLFYIQRRLLIKAATFVFMKIVHIYLNKSKSDVLRVKPCHNIYPLIHDRQSLKPTKLNSNENIFRVTGSLWGEFTGHRWIPFTKAGDVELWFFFYLRLNKLLSKRSGRRWFETPSR